MGLLQTLGLRPSTNKVEAQLAPAVMSTTYGYGSYNTGTSWGLGTMLREEAIQVPAVNACRNIITGVIASLDI